MKALATAGMVALAGLLTTADCVSEEPAHDLWERGECSSCHEEAPRYHLESRWDVLHGRLEPALSDRCETCHEGGFCVDCHAQAPDTHTAAFTRPGTRSDDGALHALLGRLRPSACAACHDRLAADCGSCHLQPEIAAWDRQAVEELSRWAPLLEASP